MSTTDRPTRAQLNGRLAALKRVVLAGAIACFAAVATAAASQSSSGGGVTSKSSGRSQSSGTQTSANAFWDDASTGTATLGGGSDAAPVAGSHAS